jgi:hypothetical protein
VPDRSRRVAVLVLIGAIAAVFAASYNAMVQPHPSGLEETGTHLAGAGLLIVAVWMAVVGYGVWRARTWAHIAGLLTFGAMSVVTLILSVDVVRRMQQISAQPAPPVHLVAPALITICAGSITALIAGAARQASAKDPNPASEVDVQ